ncbi:SWI/SNF-related matrix-associated actin-dependent regulator of chromatin subfamily A containing DEAD/H box 1 -like protein [Asbolus verrucosus]|uniref:SWI/SNF-related matrix-associated actin-dependent regulator of chromatin subfamily A containing DEAD/H box 1 homolog n=1 Tax=Asbolus verrucosus TaxID=1661398 RepID=A0A482WCT7_ASBVE|nr:SWI/SNF-related matrix-associated actin-dependent regulator of chromatin subfamily A containing DEAD/H box 1 -like protein [Asbolus verrucosus]
MSGEGSPTLLNLRDYRIQKKSILSHRSNNNSPANSSPNGTVRRRIIEMADSDSDCDSSATTHQDTGTSKLDTIILPNNSKSMKHPSVLEKENQMKYLLSSFPNVDAMVIHDVLSRHEFNVDEAALELSRCHAIELKSEGYAKWKEQNGLSDQHSHIKRRKSDEDTDDSAGSNHDFKDRRVFDSDEDSDVEISDELTGDKRKVFEFMQTATEGELQLMNFCSKKKADAIIEARPFEGWVDLVQKLSNNKNLNTDLLNAAQQVLMTRNNIRHLMKKCTNLAQQMEKAVAAGAGVKAQPRSLSVSLRLTNYQMVGLNWLAVLHAQRVNGILADEMGLGKTVQVIAFLAYLKETGQAQNTHLVVVPSSTLDNWRSEFTRWCPELRVFMYYGSTEERRLFRVDFAKGILADFDVILTTYTLVGNSPEERKMFRVTPMHYVIFDEAHMLKNMNTQRYENLIRINAKHRILLTGTPLQNNLLELMSLLIFVMPKMFAEKTDDLKSLFQKNSKTKQTDDSLPAFEREQIEQAKRIMKPFVLRRLKCDVLQDLPKKIDHVIRVPMAPTQKEQYEALVASFQSAAVEEEGAYNGMSIMTDLRKLSNHPLLLRYHYDEDQVREIAKLLAKDPSYKDTKEEYIVQDLLFMSDFEINKLTKIHRSLDRYMLPDNLILTSGKFLYLDKVLSELKQTGHRVLIFSQYVIMLNVMEDYLKIRKYNYLRMDGSTPVNERQELIDEYTEDSSIFIFLLSTRAGGLGINLTSADTVIIHDIDFNPYNDKQAEDRCHRMGQTRPVTVYRLISQGTIEEGMLEMNKEKLKLEQQITTEESDNPDVKSVVRLLSSALGVDTSKATTFVSPPKKKT